MKESSFEFNERQPDPGLDVLGELAKMIAETMLEDPDVPEEIKINVRLMIELKQLEELLQSLVEYSVPEFRKERVKQLYPLRKEVCEYLQLVKMGMREFIRTHPMPEEQE